MARRSGLWPSRRAATGVARPTIRRPSGYPHNRYLASPLCPRRAHSPCHLPCPRAVRLGGRARCLVAGPPGSRRRTALPAVAHRRGARLGIPRPCPCPVACSPLVRLGGRARCPHRAAAPSARCAAWQVAHAESFACRGSVRGTVCGRAAHPARWGHRALPPLHPQKSRRHYSHAKIAHHATTRDGSPPSLWRGKPALPPAGAPGHP